MYLFSIFFLSLKFVYAVSWFSWCPGAESEGGGGVGVDDSFHKIQRRSPVSLGSQPLCETRLLFLCHFFSLLREKTQLHHFEVFGMTSVLVNIHFWGSWAFLCSIRGYLWPYLSVLGLGSLWLSGVLFYPERGHCIKNSTDTALVSLWPEEVWTGTALYKSALYPACVDLVTLLQMIVWEVVV